MCRPLNEPPQNLDAFIDEMAVQIGDLFGALAETHYRNHAYQSLAASFANPTIDTWGAIDGANARSLLFGTREPHRTTITLAHTLYPYRASDAPKLLLEAFVASALVAGTPALTDYLSLDALDLTPSYAACGFRLVPRQLMVRDSPLQATAVPLPPPLREARAEDLDALAEVLVACYASHTERFLFPEVHSKSAARDFLQHLWSGALGAHGQSFTLSAWQDGTCTGFIAGTSVYPQTGFIVHLAVLPAHRGAGLGGQLLDALFHRMYALGMERILLGVTSSNPAVRLYQRQGFRLCRELSVYHRSGAPSARPDLAT